jgi:superfamily I DNA/RNA helicase/mRNA-degrading endonuclease RelE of RelBE toxin-antitoxin system
VRFRIADTFVDSLARLTHQEQKLVKTAAFDLQVSPATPGMHLHKLDRARDPGFRSVRVSRDLRLIVHQTSTSRLLCYVGHHDDAYRWAERRKIERHPTTGAAQLVEIRERVQEVVVPTYVAAERPAAPKSLLFADVSEQELLRYGVPSEWIDDVRRADEETVLDLADHLPREAGEALLELATGGTPQVAEPIAANADPFGHPDAQRRFRVMQDVEALKAALEYPWEKWAVFLHPEQQNIVKGDYGGPARVSGSAGTGKTVVALHRAVHLARIHRDARVLLTTFSDALANALRDKLKQLISREPRLGERVEVHALNAIGQRLYGFGFGELQVATREEIATLLADASEQVGGHKFRLQFLISEWEQVIDAWQLQSWEAYRDVLRLGRKTRRPESQRKVLWSIFELLRSKMKDRGLSTYAEMFGRVTAAYQEGKPAPFDFVVVDEAQDVSVAQLRFLSALGADRPNGLFFAGDLGQRIFQQPFSWLTLGVDIRGRSRTLRVNYRTSHQIRMQADRLLGPELSDVDGITERRRGTISVFNGPKPGILVLDSEEEEIEVVGQWLLERLDEGLEAHEIGIFVRSADEMARARAAIEAAGLTHMALDEDMKTTTGNVSLCTMHLAKGLEFRGVVVMACDDEVIPLQERIETVADDSDLEEVYNTERHLLYVACTRARDYLLVTGVEPVSEFVDDLKM